MELLNALSQIGFTEYEAKVYLALLRESPATGYQVSKTSGVPRSMVYEALSRLHTRGAVLESVEDRSSMYRPLPPDLLLERHHDEHLQLAEKLRIGLTRVYNAPTEEKVWSLSGRQTILTYVAQIIDQAQREVMLVLTDDDVRVLSPKIAAACQRGVNVQTLLTGNEMLEYGEVAYHPPLESELHGLTGMLMVVADGSQVLIAGLGQELATITRNLHLVGIARQFVWMEFFTQRIYTRLGGDLLERLDPKDRQIFESFNGLKDTHDEERSSDKRRKS